MNRYLRRLDAIEPDLRARMPLSDELEAMLSRYAGIAGVTVDELRADAVRIAWETRGMTADERLAWVAADAGCTVDEFRRDLEGLMA